MRRLLIDDNIRGFAIRYQSQMETAYPNVISDIECLKDNLVKYNSWKDSNGIKDYFNEIISDYPALLALEPNNWDIQKYLDLEKKNPGFLKRTVKYGEVKKTHKDLTDSVYKRILFCLRYSEARLILGPIHREMGLKTCVYCNTQNAESAENEVFYEMDHLMAQSDYPFLGPCFYNLQPCDGGCNKRKQTKPCDFQLYVNNSVTDLSPFKLKAYFQNIGPVTSMCDKILFLGKNGITTSESEAYDRTFQITKKYESHRDEAAIICKKACTLNQSGIDAYEASIGYRPSREQYIDYIIGIPFDESLIHGAPLRKLKFDILSDLDNSGVIKI